MTKHRNYADLTQNPCKMCMPLGAMLAFKGIEGSMTLLHGSQGCATYIRRHMAGHFNEPVDIASSSLNEHGTVHGGADNMKKALRNLIRLYQPKVIGVATTCLAETIGEDIVRITREFREEWKRENGGVEPPVLVPVQTPGYGGTQFDGWFAALLSMVRELVPAKSGVEGGAEVHAVGQAPAVGKKPAVGKSTDGESIPVPGETRLPRVNLVLPSLSPADMRNLKDMLALYPVEATLLPDLSETLDGPWKLDYTRIPEGGTPLSAIREMGGADLTIEFGVTVPDALSPGLWLEKNCGVRLERLPLPVGLEATDKFLAVLESLTGIRPERLVRERGRLLDAMVDSHKHLGEGRACVYGEPELVAAVARLYMENGLRPVLTATGAVNPKFRTVLAENAAEWPELWGDEAPEHIDDTDFATIRDKCRESHVTLLTGGSEGKFITERDGIPLVRVGFPIHDRIGGQRVTLTGYNGATALMDMAANALLERKYGTYRKRMHSRFYMPLATAKDEPLSVDPIPPDAASLPSDGEPGGRPAAALRTPAGSIPLSANTPSKTIEERTAEHPCYGEGACRNARIHLPVAPACNISCNYCNRKFDCVNESRPGVTSEVLTSEEAVAKYLEVRARVPNLKVVGIAGPGDALANFDVVRDTLRGIRAVDDEVTFCLSTNGLMLPFHARELVALGVTHVTVTMNTTDPKIGARIYRDVRYLGRRLVGVEAAEVLMKNQIDGIRFLASAGVKVKVNVVMIKGINDADIPNVVREAKACGAFMTNIMPLIPAPGSAFENRPMTGNVELNDMRTACEIDLKQMRHCRQCRADAIGTLAEDLSPKFRKAAGRFRAEAPQWSGTPDAGTAVAESTEPRVNPPLAVAELAVAELAVSESAALRREIFQTVPESMATRKEILLAVATRSGLMIDAHFGQVEEFRIFRAGVGMPEFVETRKVPKYCAGPDSCDDHDDRIARILGVIGDCRAVLALRIGHGPSERLESAGIAPVMTCGSFEEGIAYALEQLREQERMKQETA